MIKTYKINLILKKDPIFNFEYYDWDIPNGKNTLRWNMKILSIIHNYKRLIDTVKLEGNEDLHNQFINQSAVSLI